MTDDFDETLSFKIVDQKLHNLLKRLHDKNVCGCCVSRALTYHGAHLAEQTMGNVNAAEMLEYIASALRENNFPLPDPSPSMEAH